MNFYLMENAIPSVISTIRKNPIGNFMQNIPQKLGKLAFITRFLVISELYTTNSVLAQLEKSKISKIGFSLLISRDNNIKHNFINFYLLENVTPSVISIISGKISFKFMHGFPQKLEKSALITKFSINSTKFIINFD